MANPFTSPEEQMLKQRQRMADLLRSSALQGDEQTQAVGGWAIPNNQVTPFKRLGMALIANRAQRGVDEDVDAYTRNRSKQLAEALKSGDPNAVMQIPGFEELAGQMMRDKGNQRFKADQAAIQRRADEDKARKDREADILRTQTSAGARTEAARIAAEARESAARLGGGGQAPSAIQVYEYVKGLDPKGQELFFATLRGPQFVNQGDTITVPNPVNPSGPPTATFPVNPKPDQMPEFKADVASAVEQGRAAGAAAATAPAKNLERDRLIADLKSARGMPGFRSIFGSVQGRIPDVTQDARDARARVNDIIANLSLEGRQKLQGGGSVSDFEGRLLGQAATLLSDPTISDEMAVQEVDKLIAELEAAKTWTGEAIRPQGGASGTWGQPPAGWSIKKKNQQDQ